MEGMRHSGWTTRPPGPDSLEGLLPDLWGFGSSRELLLLTPALRRARPGPAGSRAPPPREAVDGILERIGRLFA
jgi:hypothetical protein